jgi:hypothetical protein
MRRLRISSTVDATYTCSLPLTDAGSGKRHYANSLANCELDCAGAGS